MFMDEGIIYEEGTPQELFNNPRGKEPRNFGKGFIGGRLHEDAIIVFTGIGVLILLPLVLGD